MCGREDGPVVNLPFFLICGSFTMRLGFRLYAFGVHLVLFTPVPGVSISVLRLAGVCC